MSGDKNILYTLLVVENIFLSFKIFWCILEITPNLFVARLLSTKLSKGRPNISRKISNQKGLYNQHIILILKHCNFICLYVICLRFFKMKKKISYWTECTIAEPDFQTNCQIKISSSWPLSMCLLGHGSTKMVWF